MIINRFRHKFDSVPVMSTSTWEQLAAELAEPRLCACTLSKCLRAECPAKNGPAWSPVSYAPGATRGNAGVTEVHVLVIDLDHVHPVALENALQKLEPYKRIVHASHSDNPQDRCLRGVLALSRPVPGADWPRFWRAVIPHLGLEADKQTKDQSRLFFLPSRPADAAGDEVDGTGYTYEVADGAVIDVDAILSLAPPLEEHEAYEIPEFTGEPDDDAMLAAVQALAAAWPPRGGRHGASLALTGALALAGWPVELIAEFATAVSEYAETGAGEFGKRLEQARSSVEKAQAGSSIQGWPTLAEMIGEDAVRTASAHLGMARPPDISQSTGTFGARIAAANPLPVPPKSEFLAELEAAETRLIRSTLGKKKLEGKLLKAARFGKPLCEPDEDAEEALVSVIRSITALAPRGTTSRMIAEHVSSSVPEISEQDLITIVEVVSASAHPTEASTSEFAVYMSGPQTGQNLPSQGNIDIAFSRLNIGFSFNEFSRRKLITQGDTLPTILQDAHITSLWLQIERDYKFRSEHGYFGMVVDDRARANSFHPVRDYLNAAQAAWTGAGQEVTIDNWVIKLAGAKDTPYVRAVSRLMLVAAVRRIRKPGCKFDEMMVLESAVQGKGKSQSLRALAVRDEWFTDRMPFDANQQKQMEAIAGKWIIECGELAGKDKANVNTVKNFMSAQFDEGRMAYGHEPEIRPRECVFFGTVNDQEYLKDQTGNRRYWPVTISEFDVEALIACRDQLWGEAATAEATGESIRLDPSLYTAAGVEQSQREIEEPMDIILSPLFSEGTGKVQVTDVWKAAGFDPSAIGQRIPSQAENNRITATMRKLGWQKSKRRFGGEAHKAFVRGTDQEQGRELRVVGSAMSNWSVVETTRAEDGSVAQAPQTGLAAIPKNN